MLDKIINAINLAGAATPAFKAIFDIAVASLSAADQATAKDAYARSISEADAAHNALQATD